MFEIQVALQKNPLTTRTYEHHRIEASFSEEVGGPSPVAVRVSGDLTASGEAWLELPDPVPAPGTLIDPVSLRIIGPDGRVLFTMPLTITGQPSPLSFQPAVEPGEPTTAFEVAVTVTRPPGSPPTLPGGGITATDYTGHRVTASFVHEVPMDGGGTALAAGKTSTNLGSDGASPPNGVGALSLPNLETLRGSVRFQLLAPDGTQIDEQSIDVSALQAGPAPFPVSFQQFPLVVFPPLSTEDPGFGKPPKIRGRVLDQAGKVKFVDRQVLLYAKSSPPPADDAFVPLLVTTTVGGGYFSAPYPVGRFEEAFAVVGASSRLTVPIRLDDDGTFPANLLIVVEATEEDAQEPENDCACAAGVPRFADAEDIANAPELFAADVAAGGCIDFLKPNRALEGFNFTKVVRTSEPEIRGLVISDLQTVPVSFVQISLTTDAPASQRAALDTFVAGNGGANAEIPLDIELADALIADQEGFTMTKLQRAIVQTQQKQAAIEADRQRASSVQRVSLGAECPIDWDDTPTVFQASTVAHGHLLCFRQEWFADGYSLGDLLYSLPLAPGQKKNIAIIDWERRETAGRVETLEEREALSAALTRDRDISEIVTGALREDTRGGSSASTSSVSGGGGIGFGIPIGGGFLGIGGGAAGGNGSSSSSAWQSSSRDTVATSLQNLSDRTAQSAQSVRGQRSSVIQTVTEKESVAVTTEVVANHNHCHTLTIQYFEVLRHFLVRQRLVDVQECLLVPFLMSPFDSRKALRWRALLSRALLDPSLVEGFAAMERIQNSYVGSDVPKGRFADEEIDFLEGFLRIRFKLSRPRDNEDGTFAPAGWLGLGLLLPSITAAEFWTNFLRGQAERDRIFLEQMGRRMVEAVVDGLRMRAVRPKEAGGGEVELPIDATLVSDFVNDRELFVSIRLSNTPPPIRRSDIAEIRILGTMDTPAGPKRIEDLLPANSKVIVESGQLRYQLKHSRGDLFNSPRIRDDLGGMDPDVLIFTPLGPAELRNPREEDQQLRLRLLKHLNENLEHYHRVIWLSMSADRRYMLLDGIIAPGSGGRSVASVVENRLIGIAGNTMIFPVVAGIHLDPTFQPQTDPDGVPLPIRLLDHYQPAVPPPVSRFAVPTKGVFAEAVQGACNACETKDESRFWRWEEAPNPDEPTPIQQPSTATRGTSTTIPQPTFPAPLINLQNAPAEPNPLGVAGVLQLLGNPNLFRDITGLTENQKNALQALQASLNAAQTFGQQAANVALQAKMSQDIDKTLGTIKKAESDGIIDSKQKNSLAEQAIRSSFGGGANPAPAQPIDTKQVGELVNTAGANKAAVSVSRAGGDAVSIDARPAQASDTSGTGTIIVLPTPESSPESRAFFPSRLDASGITTLSAVVRNAPAGATTRWSLTEPNGVSIESPNGTLTRIFGLRPGITNVDFTVRDGAGTSLASVKVRLSVPQFVTIDEDAAAFNAALAAFGVLDIKDGIVRQARATVESLLRAANVRTVWRVGPFSESVPAHVTDPLVTKVTIRNEPPAATPGLAGLTHPDPTTQMVGPDVMNETVDIFPGAFDNQVASPVDVDTQTRAFVLQLTGQNLSDPKLKEFAMRFFGRLFGETIAHEIGHCLLGELSSGSDRPHNDPPVPNDLMNNGRNRPFAQRTGLVIPTQSPINPDDVVDNGIGAIGGFQSIEQQLLSARFPVPPAFA